MTKWHLAGAMLATTLLLPLAARAHGIVGDRFFPATITSDDPFAADELALPTITLGNHEEDYEFEYTKSIFPHFAVSFGGGYVDAHPPGGPNASGWENFEITPMWQFETDADSEFVASAGMSFEIGGSGAKAVADRFTTYTPEFLYGKGFGDLPDSMALLRPLAVTGVLAYSIPGTSSESKAVQWSGAVEYSLLYLQNNVRDEGLSKFVAHLTPLIEYSMSTPTDSGGTTGTIDPGVLWSGQYTQLGVEAVIPVNRASGENVGVVMQLHFYIDDIFPDSLGAPIFGGKR
ncbi:MAG TPA: hypothetical protein VJ476_01210 [Rhizomicrobium sp.]|nr:hypothetical protein [Rhizomicrobium sp.]